MNKNNAAGSVAGMPPYFLYYNYQPEEKNNQSPARFEITDKTESKVTVYKRQILTIKNQRATGEKAMCTNSLC